VVLLVVVVDLAATQVAMLDVQLSHLAVQKVNSLTFKTE
jgi:hypothetical protein